MNLSTRTVAVRFDDTTGLITCVIDAPDNPQEKKVLGFILLDIKPNFDVTY